MTATSYDYQPWAYHGWETRACRSNPDWHENRTKYLQRHHGPEAFSRLLDDHPLYVTSPRGGLTHRVEFVVQSNAPKGYGYAVEYYLVCGQLRSEDRTVPVSNPEFVCHLCHDRHWIKTGEHLLALPQSGCELTEGRAYVSDRAHMIRLTAPYDGSEDGDS